MVTRVLIGKHPDNTYGLKVSEPGYDVMTNPVDRQRMIFDSTWVALNPILYRGETYVGAGTSVTDFYPSLGYIPFAFTQWFPNYASGFFGKGYIRRNPFYGYATTDTYFSTAYANGVTHTNYTTTTALVQWIVFEVVAFT
jgi:hypothetical protein